MKRFALTAALVAFALTALFRAHPSMATGRSMFMCDGLCQSMGVPPAGMTDYQWQNYQMFSTMGYVQPVPGQLPWITPSAISQRYNPYFVHPTFYGYENYLGGAPRGPMPAVPYGTMSNCAW